MFTVAARAPVAAGVKLMLIVQLAPGATEPAPVGQVLPAAKAKSAACVPVMVMPVRFSGAPPLLVRVTVCAGRSEERRVGKEGRLGGAQAAGRTVPEAASGRSGGGPDSSVE